MSEKFAPYRRTTDYPHAPAVIPWVVHLHAYEVYRVVYGTQEALLDLEGRNCRGGFGTGELFAFLYAHSFPQAEWRQRVNEAMKGMME